MSIGTYISIINLNVNGLNASTKRHRRAEWTQKQDPYIGSLPEKEFRITIVKMIQNLEYRIEKIQETFKKELEELKNKQIHKNPKIDPKVC